MEEPSPRCREVLERLLRAHEGYFDVQRDHGFAGRTFEGYAEFHGSTSRYVLSKRAKLWEANSHEYLFFTLAGHLDQDAYDELVGFMKTEALAKVTLGPNHMNSFLSLVVIADSTDAQIARRVCTTRYRKNFQLGLKGWADLRVCVVSLDDGAVYANAMGKDMAKTLAANAFG
ncbi:MAG: hypothetical protein V8R08_01380 [Coriobacteriales bacterium]